MRHAFTHFALELDVYVAKSVTEAIAQGVWAPLAELDAFALPNVMRKVLAHALGAHNAGPLFDAKKEGSE